MSLRRCAILSVSASLALGGCIVGPNYHRPHVNMPAGWVGPVGSPTTSPSTQPAAPSEQEMRIERWWTIFHDPTLDSLVERAMNSNLDLRLAEARIRQARAARGVAGAGLWPTVEATGTYRRLRSGGGGVGVSPGGATTTAGGAVGGAGAGPIGGGTGAGGLGAGPINLFQAGLDAAWEMDVFGGTRRSIEAAQADLQAAAEDRRDVMVTLISEVALNYLELRGFQQRIAIAKQNLQAQVHSADLTRMRFAGGLVSRLDVANAEAQVATTRATIPPLAASAEQTIYGLSLLLGLTPDALLKELSPEGRIPTTPPDVPIGLPSDLLRRRPDVRRAEAQAHAATARIGVAIADLFPKFTLTGAAGASSTSFSSLGNWKNRFYSGGPGVSWEIFDAGRVQWNIRVQNTIQQQALITYQQTVLTALRDVNSALVAYACEQEHRQALVEAVNRNLEAVDLATQSYTQGQTDFINVLNAQRSLLTAQDALVQSNRSLATDLVALYKALGGGWELQDPGADNTRAASDRSSRPKP